MNLKKISDDFWKTQKDGGYRYKQYKYYQSDLSSNVDKSRARVYPKGSRKLYDIYGPKNSGGVYSLMQIDASYSEDTFTYTKDEIIDVLKHLNFSEKSSTKELFLDLKQLFELFITKEVIDNLKRAYPGVSNFVIDVNTIHSTGDLLKSFVGYLDSNLHSLSYLGTTLKFVYRESFSKSDKLWFDGDAYYKDLLNSKYSDEAKEKSDKEVEEFNNYIEKLNGAPFSFSKSSYVGSRVILRKYVKGLVDYNGEHIASHGTIVMDDFLTTGTTINSMLSGINNVPEETMFALCMFKSK